MVADSGPFASLEIKPFNSFVKEWDIKTTTTSPYFAKSKILSKKAVVLLKTC